MVPPALPAGTRLLALACCVAAGLAAAPAAADTTATMTVRARVVDRCRIELPDAVPPHARDRLPDHVGNLVDHSCRGRAHPRITAGPLPGRVADRAPPRAVASQRHPGQGHVLITLTY